MNTCMAFIMLSFASAYVSEERDGVSAVGGCSARLKPLPETKTLDLALILFPPQTSDRWFEINPSYVPAVGDKLVYFGFGSTIDPFTNSGVIGIRKSAPALRFSQSKVWRASQQRVGFVAPQHLAFAAEGDSGGPVLVDRKLVGVVSTLSERCEIKVCYPDPFHESDHVPGELSPPTPAPERPIATPAANLEYFAYEMRIQS